MKKRTSGEYRKLERIVKGFANHRRLEIIDLLKQKPELSVADIAEELHIDFKNASAHIGKLAIAGLIMKRYEGTTVRHKLTKRGESILIFYRILE